MVGLNVPHMVISMTCSSMVIMAVCITYDVKCLTVITRLISNDNFSNESNKNSGLR